ncbi:MAG: ATP-dependent sacrificial sulfur transferase LarE [Butyricicoccus sp.]|nr:ATP-dependent sacrificial sulfur transferase LarE [Butyricicoccus sp.]
MILEEFFRENGECALAFSGGADSAFLLYAAQKYARRVRAYYVKSAFQPGFELDDARRLAAELDADMRVLDVDVLALEDVRENPPERCYHCKRAIFSAIAAAAHDDGFGLIIDGTNASDNAGDRPGMRALRELAVRSPLRECALTKNEIRGLSRRAGLFTWNKSAYACLATRVPAGEEITAEKLQITEAAESALHALGFRDFRVRLLGGCARVQLREGQLPLLLEKRGEVLDKLKRLYDAVLLDLEVRGEQ